MLIDGLLMLKGSKNVIFKEKMCNKAVIVRLNNKRLTFRRMGVFGHGEQPVCSRTCIVRYTLG